MPKRINANGEILDFDYYYDRLCALHLDDPFNITTIVDQINAVLDDEKLNTYAKYAVLCATLEMSQRANFISLSAAGKVQRYYSELTEKTVTQKEWDTSLDNKLKYLKQYPLQTNYRLDGKVVRKTDTEQLKDWLAINDLALVTGQDMTQCTGKHFVGQNTTILPDTFYLLDNQLGDTNTHAYHYLGKRLIDVITAFIDHEYQLNAYHQIVPDDVPQYGFNQVERRIYPTQCMLDFN